MVDSKKPVIPGPGNRSEKLYAEACEVIAGGVSRNTVFRQPYPVYVGEAKGCNVVPT